MKKLVEVHVLQNFAPSNLNRDDTGAPKDALFGGARRARISSQCQKYAVRHMFDVETVFHHDDLAIRTRYLVDALQKQLVGMGHSENDNTKKAINSILVAADKDLIKKNADGKKKMLQIKEEGKNSYLLFLGRNTIHGLAKIVNGILKKEIKQDLKANDEIRELIRGDKAADIALFGRMLADMPTANQYAACQVAHAISTHAIEREFDFYTAVDNFKQDDVPDAGMMGVIDFNSACYYRYACLDVELLENNLQGDRELANKTVRAFLDAFIRSEPTGKQNSFAAHNPPEFILLRTAQNAAPINLANAFEAPVRAGWDKSLTRLSAEKLVEKAGRLRELYGYSGDSLVLNACDADLPNDFKKSPSWPKLLDDVITIVEKW